MDFQPSRELSFVAGAFLGDGSFVEDSDYHHFVRLSVRDRDFAEAFNRSMAKVLSRQVNNITVTTNKGKVYYDAKYSSRELGLFLKQPLGNLRPLVESCPAAFLRGLFSADGCASVFIDNNRLRAAVVLGNSNRELLELTENVLQSQFQISSRTYLSRRRGATWKNAGKTVILRKDAYQLRVQRLQDVRAFAAKVGFEIRRKQETLETALRLLETLGRAKAAEVRKRHHHKVGFRWQKVGSS